MKIKYKDKNFRSESLALIARANKIISEYSAQGFDLTLRQLYYQFVSRDLIANTTKEYKRLGNVVNDARLAGLIDWDSIEDRTRNLKGLNHWSTPSEIIEACVHNFRLDKWEGQDNYIEVWIEKDALIGVIQRICNKNDVNYFSCRGYVSQSEMHGAAQRFRRKCHGKQGVLIHLGDHDPSGKDMPRDIYARLKMFGAGVKVKRIALTMDQIEELLPPPNPAKLTDTRARDYIKKYGDNSWELDALDPSYIENIIDETIQGYVNSEILANIENCEEEAKRKIQHIANNYDEITEGV
jgi:hypothetical protein